MTKVVKFSFLGVGLALLPLALVLGEQVYLDRRLCHQMTDALVQLYDLNVKMSLQRSVPNEQLSGFKDMMKSKAVFLTKLREYGEMKTDLEESLKTSHLSLDSLSLANDSVIPEFTNNGKPLIESELGASETYEPRAEDTFTTQSWVAKIHGKKDGPASVQAWIEKNKVDGNIALIADKISMEGGSVLLYFRSGMIPAMKMPKRVLQIDHVNLPVRPEGHFFKFISVDFMNYKACAQNLAIKFNTLREKILREAPRTLESLEKADKTKWLWMASVKSKEFIEQAKSTQK